MTEKKKDNRGGKREGSGRKPNEVPRKRRSIYCNSQEFHCLKALMECFKRIEQANKAILKAKGDKEAYDRAVSTWIQVQKEVEQITVSDLKSMAMEK